jgi:hypothetical protein
MSAEELQRRPRSVLAEYRYQNSPRAYNQVNVPRKYVTGKRRFTIY